MRELVKYVVAGVINTVVGYGVFLIFFQLLKFSPETSNAIGYLVALSVAFLLNHFFVFTASANSARSLKRFILAFSGSFLVNQAVLFVLFRMLSVQAEIAQAFAMITYTLIFYLLNKHFVFIAR